MSSFFKTTLIATALGAVAFAAPAFAQQALVPQGIRARRPDAVCKQRGDRVAVGGYMAHLARSEPEFDQDAQRQHGGKDQGERQR